MRVVTWNLNGIRAAHRKGLYDFIDRIDADVMLFQEVRALPEQMPKIGRSQNGTMSFGIPRRRKGIRA